MRVVVVAMDIPHDGSLHLSKFVFVSFASLVLDAPILITDDVGQFYNVHHDYIKYQLDRFEGVRILTMFLYLNDVEEGGGTNFPHLGDLVSSSSSSRCGYASASMFSFQSRQSHSKILFHLNFFACEIGRLLFDCGFYNYWYCESLSTPSSVPSHFVL